MVVGEGKEMKAWRVILAMALLLASYLGLFYTTLYMNNPVVQVFFFFLALCIGMIGLSLAQDDGRERNRKI